jgi:hypothetical protein
MKRAALIRSSFAWAILFAAVMAPASAAENCALVRLAKLDMQLDDHGGIYVPMTIAGQNANLLIDTGGIVSMLTQSWASDPADRGRAGHDVRRNADNQLRHRA